MSFSDPLSNEPVTRSGRLVAGRVMQDSPTRWPPTLLTCPPGGVKLNPIIAAEPRGATISGESVWHGGSWAPGPVAGGVLGSRHARHRGTGSSRRASSHACGSQAGDGGQKGMHTRIVVLAAPGRGRQARGRGTLDLSSGYVEAAWPQRQPKALHERTPLIIGSRGEVDRVLGFLA